jgi:hypothetical protein
MPDSFLRNLPEGKNDHFELVRRSRSMILAR